MDSKRLQEVKDALPFDVKIKLADGTIVNGSITGFKDEFPMCRLPGQGSFGISWMLAARLYFGLAEYILC